MSDTLAGLTGPAPQSRPDAVWIYPPSKEIRCKTDIFLHRGTLEALRRPRQEHC